MRPGELSRRAIGIERQREIAETCGMNAIRIRTKLESETLTLPELRPLVGKSVEIIVREETQKLSEAARRQRPLSGSILRDDDPLGPAVPASAWEAAG